VRAQNADLIARRTHGRSGIGRMLLGSVTQHVLRVVLMSSHGLTGVGRALLGSVADAVVRKADCPVLIILASDRAAVEGANSEMELATAAPATI
jgi:nucleotide-binding universal stress UspA family protein